MPLSVRRLHRDAHQPEFLVLLAANRGPGLRPVGGQLASLVPGLVAERHHAASADVEKKAMADVREYWYDKAFPKESGSPDKADTESTLRRGYRAWFIKPDDPAKRPQDGAGYERLSEFQKDPGVLRVQRSAAIAGARTLLRRHPG